MSSTLAWHTRPAEHRLSTDFKLALRKVFDDRALNITLTSDDTPLLDQIASDYPAAAKDCRALAVLIAKHGEVFLTERW